MRRCSFLMRPAVLHEARGQVIQELRMARRIGLVAEIVGRGDDALAKMMQPDAVDQDARGQGIGGVDDRVGQFQAAAAVAEGRGGLGPERISRKPARDNVALVFRLRRAGRRGNRAAWCCRTRAVAQGGRTGIGQFQPGDLAAQLVDVLAQVLLLLGVVRHLRVSLSLGLVLDESPVRGRCVFGRRRWYSGVILAGSSSGSSAGSTELSKMPRNE